MKAESLSPKAKRNHKLVVQIQRQKQLETMIKALEPTISIGEKLHHDILEALMDTLLRS